MLIDEHANFLANISHEIRGSLAAIIGHADIARESNGVRNDETARQAVETIVRNSQHLLAVVNDILDMSKIEAGAMEVRCQPTDPVEIARSVHQSFGPIAQQRGLSFGVTHREARSLVLADPVRLEQILTNLVSNAIKFTDTGTVNIAIRSTDAHVVFEVRDTGIGMDHDDRERLFTKFSQGASAGARAADGTGLGLVIARNLARAMDGDITAESELGSGSTFTLMLPVCAQGVDESQDKKASHALADTDPKAAHLSGCDILVVDDAIDMQRLLRFYLAPTNATLTTVTTGVEALAFFAARTSTTPIVALVDLEMPGMTGDELVRILRTRGVGIPCVALTANVMASARDRCVSAGFDGYLPKPMDRQELERTVSMCLGRTAGDHLATACESTGLQLDT